MSESTLNTENMKFEDALKKLEETVALLESGKAPLDESLQYYEDGVRLVRYCAEKLSQARRRVEEVTGEKDG